MNKDNIIKAIEHYNVYTKQGRNVLKAIVASADEDYVAKVTINTLMELSNVSRQGIYNCMRYITKDGIVEANKTTGRKISLFKINKNKMQEIIEYYNNIQSAKTILKQ